MKKLAGLVLASSLFFTGCSYIENLPSLKQYQPPTEVVKIIKSSMFIIPLPTGSIQAYSTKGDGKVDYEAFYEFAPTSRPGIYATKLVGYLHDEGKGDKFTKGELHVIDPNSQIIQEVEKNLDN